MPKGPKGEKRPADVIGRIARSCGSRKFMPRSGNDAVHGPLGARLPRPVRVDGQVGRRVNPSPRIGAGAICGNKRNSHGESA